MFYINKLFFIINNRIFDDFRVFFIIGNGYIVMVVKIDMFCMNGLYNGYVIKIYRVFLLVIFVRNVSVDGNVMFKYSLDFKNGI